MDAFALVGGLAGAIATAGAAPIITGGSVIAAAAALVEGEKMLKGTAVK